MSKTKLAKSITGAGREAIQARTHTPGPWKCEKTTENATGWKGIQIVSVGGLNIANVVMQLDDKEAANARLIAAAPEGYDLLRELRDNEDFDTNDFWNRVDAYLAKAEGRARK